MWVLKFRVAVSGWNGLRHRRVGFRALRVISTPYSLDSSTESGAVGCAGVAAEELPARISCFGALQAFNLRDKCSGVLFRFCKVWRVWGSSLTGCWIQAFRGSLIELLKMFVYTHTYIYKHTYIYIYTPSVFRTLEHPNIPKPLGGFGVQASSGLVWSVGPRATRLETRASMLGLQSLGAQRLFVWWGWLPLLA